MAFGFGFALTAIAKAVGFTPRSLFTSGAQGAWYDPSDYSTMFEDAAGTTPITTPLEKPVGKMLDKSGRGNHATQSTTTSRPTLSARYNLLTKTEQFGDGAWVKAGTASTPSANSLLLPAVNAYAYQSASTTMAGQSAKISMQLSGSGTLTLGFYDNVSAFQLDTITLTSTPTTYTVTKTIGAGAIDIRAVIGRIGFGTATSVTLNQADLRVANDGVGLPAYQRVNTASDYDYAGFPPYLKFDGTDDGMATGNIDFTGTDKMSVFAGVRKLSDAAQGTVVELSVSANANNGSFGFFAPYVPISDKDYTIYTRGTSNLAVENYPYVAPMSNVFSATINIAGTTPNEEVTSRINGGAPTTRFNSGNAGTGNFGDYPLYIGRRGGSSLPFNGRLYGLAVVGKLASATEIANTENWLNGKAKAY